MNIAGFKYHSQLSFDFNYSKPLKLSSLEVSVLSLLENMDDSCFEREPDGKKPGRPACLDAYTMMVIILYARVNGRYSSRDIERLCGRDIFIHSVLDGRDYPDHVTINRFIKRHPKSIEQVLVNCCKNLDRMGELGKEILFQDGTKIESRASKYSFVWKTGILKNKEKLRWKCIKLAEEIAQYLDLESFAIDEYDDEIGKLKILRNKIELCGEKYVMEESGKGIRLAPCQRFYRKINELLDKYSQYGKDLMEIGDTRNSMSRTDKDATFMRMKEDHMRNGQLKPAYNIQTLVDSNYVVGCYSSSDRTDYATLEPSVRKINGSYDWRYKGYSADSGYDNLQNHQFLKEEKLADYIKPQNYEISKKRKARNDIGSFSNMEYDQQKNEFTCKAGKRLVAVKEGRRKSKSGVRNPVTTYECKRGCVTCPLRKECITHKGKTKHKYKRFTINVELERFRRTASGNIISDFGAEVRVNRSIQAEGTFAQIKANNSFRRFLSFGKERTTTEWILMSISINMIRFAYRIERNLVGVPFWYRIAS